MGYTHYWYRVADLDRELFKKVCLDFRKLNKVFPHIGFKLGNSFGEDEPTITFHEISFNGYDKCGHTKKDLGLTWPSKNAKGVNIMKKGSKQEAIDGRWFAGNTLNSRECDGSCSYESFVLEQYDESARHGGKPTTGPFYFSCTKTAYRPYDIAVTACLIIAKHYLGEQIRILSDGESKDWDDARMLCEQFLGYGKDFELDPEVTEKTLEVSN